MARPHAIKALSIFSHGSPYVPHLRGRDREPRSHVFYDCARRAPATIRVPSPGYNPPRPFRHSLSLSPLENVAPFAPSKAPSPSVNLFKRRSSCIPYPDFFFLNCVRRLSFPFSLLIVLLYQIYPYPDFFFLNCVHRLFFPFSLLIVLLYQIYHIFAIIFGKMSLDRLKYFIVIRFKKKKIINGTIYSIYM